MVSKKLKDAVKLDPTPQYRLALMFGLDPCWLSKALHGAVRIHRGDQRILKIARVVGVDSEDAFDENSTVNNEEGKRP